jgi:hypothetical protein
MWKATIRGCWSADLPRGDRSQCCSGSFVSAYVLTDTVKRSFDVFEWTASGVDLVGRPTGAR